MIAILIVQHIGGSGCSLRECARSAELQFPHILQGVRACKYLILSHSLNILPAVHSRDKMKTAAVIKNSCLELNYLMSSQSLNVTLHPPYLNPPFRECSEFILHSLPLNVNVMYVPHSGGGRYLTPSLCKCTTPSGEGSGALPVPGHRLGHQEPPAEVFPCPRVLLLPGLRGGREPGGGHPRPAAPGHHQEARAAGGP